MLLTFLLFGNIHKYCQDREIAIWAEACALHVGAWVLSLALHGLPSIARFGPKIDNVMEGFLEFIAI